MSNYGAVESILQALQRQGSEAGQVRAAPFGGRLPVAPSVKPKRIGFVLRNRLWQTSTFFPHLSLPLFEAYARTTAILVNELEARGFEGAVQCFDCPFLQFVPPLKPGDGIDRHLSGCREFSDPC
jgi:hypothetical protein